MMKNNNTSFINTMVYETLLDDRIEAVSNQSKHLDTLLPIHNSNIDRMLYMRQIQQNNQQNQLEKMYMKQSTDKANLELKQQTGKQATPELQSKVKTEFNKGLDALQQQAAQSMIPNGYVSMPYKLSPKLNKVVKKLEDTRDHLFNFNQGLV